MKVIKAGEAAFAPVGAGGIEKAVLWREGLAVAFDMFRLPKGSVYPKHGHQHWEAMYILEGRIAMDGVEYAQGDFLFTTPGEVHEVEMLEETLALFGFGQRPDKQAG
jgi:quercetin dioxygenase-like cupin family protein